MPTLLGEHFMIDFIALSIPSNFLSPEIAVSAWPMKPPAIVHVPKTTVNKYDCTIFFQHDIWAPRQYSNILPVTEAFGEQVLSHSLFWFGVNAANS
jgi:hypothetical protein